MVDQEAKRNKELAVIPEPIDQVAGVDAIHRHGVVHGSPRIFVGDRAERMKDFARSDRVLAPLVGQRARVPDFQTHAVIAKVRRGDACRQVAESFLEPLADTGQSPAQQIKRSYFTLHFLFLSFGLVSEAAPRRALLLRAVLRRSRRLHRANDDNSARDTRHDTTDRPDRQESMETFRHFLSLCLRAIGALLPSQITLNQSGIFCQQFFSLDSGLKFRTRPARWLALRSAACRRARTPSGTAQAQKRARLHHSSEC